MATFEIRVDFYNPANHSLTSDGHPAWPPDPVRLASALVAGAHAESPDHDAVAALAALVKLPQPVILSPHFQEAILPGVFAAKSGSPDVEGRAARVSDLTTYVDASLVGLSSKNKVKKPTSRVFLDDCTLVYLVDDPDGTVDIAALDRAARRVAYLGRSNDYCDITVDTPREPLPALTLRPIRNPVGRYRGWAPNSLEWMDANHHLTTSGSEIPPLHWATYSVPLDYTDRKTPPPPADGGAGRVIPLRAPITQATAWRLLSKLPPQADVTIYPCVTAGHPSADGAVRGFGIAGSPERLGEADRVLRSALGESAAPVDLITTLKTLQPATWERPSLHWISAMPLRAFPDERVAEYTVRKELAALGAECEELILTRRPKAWQRRTPQPPDGHGLWWCELTLDRPLTGPLLLGTSTEAGFGLMLPRKDKP